MTRILVISGDILPFPGFPTTGAGLRAWGLGKGLESKGHDVILAMPRSSLPQQAEAPEALRPLLYEHQELDAFIRAHEPDVVVLQHWALASYIQESLAVPLVIDFHGPLLLETQFQDNPALERLRLEKIKAFNKADFFTCAGEKQRYYFQGWLMMAGFDLREDIIQSIPVSLSPDLPEHINDTELTFVYGGVFLPWQDPSLGLQLLIECLEKKQSGYLHFFGGKHPAMGLPTGDFEILCQKLSQSSRVNIQPIIPREDLLQRYCRAAAAMDLMRRNPERELAFTTRTVEYLWCGLPVFYNNYAELAGYIREYEAGWTLDPEAPDAIRRAIEDVLDDPAQMAQRSRNAQRLVRERLTWDKTIAPLDAFCRAPKKREKHTPILTSSPRPSFLRQLAHFTSKRRVHL